MNRQFAAAMLLLVGCSLALGPLTESSTAIQPYRVSLPIVTAEDTRFWGIQPYPYARLLEPAAGDALVATGSGWIRVPLRWLLVEPQNTTPDKFDLSYYDRYWAEAAQRGQQVIVTLEDAPSWAAELERGPLRPGMLPEWLQFVEAVVSRYSKPPYHIHYWEIYNEPDGLPAANALYVGAWGEDPLGFASLLKATYPVIKRADPQAQVLISLAYAHAGDDTRGGLFVPGWLDRVIDPAQGNAGDAFDVYGVHAYTFFRKDWDAFGRDIIGKTNYIRDSMAKYGVRKLMMVTEMGEVSGVVATLEEQARYAIKGMIRSLVAGHITAIWFTQFDYDDLWRRGVMEVDTSPRPAVFALRTLTKELRNPVYIGEISSRLSVSPEVEGYFFSTSDGETLSIWLDDSTGLTRTVQLPGKLLRVADRNGTVKSVADADDGASDGFISLAVTTEPLFVRAAK